MERDVAERVRARGDAEDGPQERSGVSGVIGTIESWLELEGEDDLGKLVRFSDRDRLK